MSQNTDITVAKFAEGLDALRKRIGVEAYVSVHLTDGGDKPVSGSIYPDGICKDMAFSKSSATLKGILTLLNEGWDEFSAAHRARTIRKIALGIIRITAEYGQCSDAALRQEFGAAYVGRYGALACEDANAIASNGPFSIVALSTANAA